MNKIMISCLLLAVMLIMLPGCTTITGDNKPSETTASSAFTGMLEMVPYALFEQHDISYGSLGQAKELYGVANIDSMEALNQLPKEERDKFISAWNEMAGTVPTWNSQTGDGQGGIVSLTGIDVFSFDRTITINNMPPRISYIAQGDFDEELIAGKLTEQGYTKTNYGNYSYFEKGGDYNIEFTNPISKIAMAAMNRVAVLDNTLVISPATGYVTGILDTMAGNASSIIDNDICKALADSLGEVLIATITTPERIIIGMDNKGVFNFTIPGDWGTLLGYEMAALGYRAEGDSRYFDIALYYKDKQTAEADGKTITNRMGSYTLNTFTGNTEKKGFTEKYQPGEPVITKYGEGYILKISCLVLSPGKPGLLMFMGGSAMPMRDLLFLAPDPEKYVK
ncbi:MAG: hypothetical protein A2Y90_05150 [Chloroflexi bacterium RBG_13_52_12]|nr:MAG: hypothetical protein A2Y90_05150 [Chloroflexi bacterium RBG_13_52_12]